MTTKRSTQFSIPCHVS